MSTDFINELEQFFFASKIQALVRGCRKRRIIENNKIKLENSKLKILLKRSQAQTGPRDLIDNFTQDEVSENYLSDDMTIGTVTSIGSQSSIQLLKHVQDLEKLVTMQAETIKKLTLMNNSSVSRSEGSTQCLRDSEIAQERLEADIAEQRRTNGERGGFAGFYNGEIVALNSELNPT